MATFGSTLRRGLPRVAGAEAWPPAGDAPVVAGPVSADAAGAAEAAAVDASDRATAASLSPAGSAAAGAAAPEAPETSPLGAASDPAAPHVATTIAASATTSAGASALRRGLPRTPGGDAWPPAGTASSSTRAAASADATAHDAPTIPAVATAASESSAPAAISAPATPQIATTVSESDGAALRRGLPRDPGGEPWPPAGVARATAPAQAAAGDATPAATAAEASPDAVQQTSVTEASDDAAEPIPVAASVAPDRHVASAGGGTAVETGPRAPLPFRPSVWPGRAGRLSPAPKAEPQRIGPFTKVQWAGAVVIGGLGLLFAAAMAVLFVRVFLSLGFMQDFLATYPGEYHLPEGAPVGLPAWLGWQHFFNVFLMVLIIRTGLTIRTEKRPAVFWTPKRNPKGKTSLTIWFHQSLDLLWIVNGLVFVVLLFVTGQWMRIVPTSWEVFPNAISAALQYVSLDWPTENGWVNYNALQQIAYFSTVFLAAPLAIVTGFRMSGLWPKNNAKLNAAYPIEWARKVHFPTMLFFVVFIAIHVFLVFATGALRNLNHMYAAQGSVDPNAYADNWTGFWFFVASLVVIAVAWIAARPLVLAPIARLFGTVSGR